MNQSTFEQAFTDLFEWCRKRDFAGYDPFDALNSRLFQATPLKNFRAARLLWTQVLKGFPINLRQLALVPAERNPKGVALFALAALANYRRLRTKEAESEARELLNDLLAMQLSGFSGATWGYNFDWQSRNFFAPRGIGMIVPTAFAARAFVEAAKYLGDDRYLQTARSVCDFILQDLNRTFETEDNVCFSYSPLDRTQVFNANLLAAEVLASVSGLTREEKLCDWAIRAARYVVRRQREDGSWVYGSESTQSWIDSFHTAYLLVSLKRIMKSCGVARDGFRESLEHGYQFWRERFFLADGWPKYYHDTLYPADAHVAATAISTLVEMRDLDQRALGLAENIAAWSLHNLRDRSGGFYYQRRRFYTVRTPFMRWTEAWMLYALARLMEVRGS